MVLKLPAIAILPAHAVFWMGFIVTRMIVRGRTGAAARPETGPAQKSKGAAWFVAGHALAFAVLYNGICVGALWHHPSLFRRMPATGAALILAAMLFACWALLHFRSWRFKAQIDRGHQLATSGPFSLVRHPIYAAFCLLALGSFLWIPNEVTLAGLVLIVLFGDIRGRAEEKLLEQAFGAEYVDYKKRVARLVPLVY